MTMATAEWDNITQDSFFWNIYQIISDLKGPSLVSKRRWVNSNTSPSLLPHNASTILHSTPPGYSHHYNHITIPIILSPQASLSFPPQAFWHFAISFDAIVLNDRSTPANKAEKHFGPAPSRILAASFFTRNGFYIIAGAFGHKRLNSQFYLNHSFSSGKTDGLYKVKL